MNLNADILFHHLSLRFHVDFRGRNKTPVYVGRPRYFSHTDTLKQYASVLDCKTLSGLPPNNMHGWVVICLGEPELSRPYMPYDLITVSSSVSKETVFNALQEIYDCFEEWDKHLSVTCYEERGFSEFIESCDKILNEPICLIDNDFSYVAYSVTLSVRRGLVQKYVDENNKLPLDSVTEIISSPEYPALEKYKNVFEFSAREHMLCKNIYDENGKSIGMLQTPAPADKNYVAYVSSIFTHLSTYIEKAYQHFGSFNTERPPAGIWHQILNDGLNQHYIAEDYLEQIITESGWLNEDEYQLVRFTPNHRYDKALHALYLCPQLEHLWPESCCIGFGSCIVLLINTSAMKRRQTQGFHQKLAYFLRESLLSASISRTFQDLNQIHSAYVQTEIAMEIGTKKHPMFWYYYFDDYVFLYLFQRLGGDFTPKQICHFGLLTLKEHDKISGTDYYHTLLTYVRMQYNASSAAKALFIHRSTFLGRMERIKELTKIDFSNWEELLYILISFQILESK